MLGVAVAEERYFGGTCVNVGCVPKKLYSYAAHYKDDFEDSRGFGWESSDMRFDWEVLKKNKDIEINRLKSIYQSFLVNSGVSIFESRARLVGPNEIQVGDKIFSARHIYWQLGAGPMSRILVVQSMLLPPTKSSPCKTLRSPLPSWGVGT